MLRDCADRADQFELGMQRIREKLSDADFFKKIIKCCKKRSKYNCSGISASIFLGLFSLSIFSIHSLIREMLEDQLTQSRKRFEQSMALESEIIKYKQKLNDMALERDADHGKLLDENTQLQRAMKSLNELSDLDKLKNEELDDSPVCDNSLSEQLTNNAQVSYFILYILDVPNGYFARNGQQNPRTRKREENAYIEIRTNPREFDSFYTTKPGA